MTDLSAIQQEARACTLCASHLPLGPRPILTGKPSARILIIGQAPGTRVHESGIPWNDRSGDRLRDWLGVDREQFYDEAKIAILPMGLCYPGVLKNGGDKPPRPECAPLWHDRVIAALPEVKLTLLVGTYAQKRYLPPLGTAADPRTMSEAVERFAEYTPSGIWPLPHPSWRTTGWQKKHIWFDELLLPALRSRISNLI